MNRLVIVHTSFELTFSYFLILATSGLNNMQQIELKTATIEQCVTYLSGRCDGAQSEDGRGFNGGDAGFGKSIAALIAGGGRLTDGQARSSLSMIQKYKKQLEGGGLICPSEMPSRGASMSPVTRSTSAPLGRGGSQNPLSQCRSNSPENLTGSKIISEYQIKAEGKKARVIAPYNPTLLALIKNIEMKGRRYDSVARNWILNAEYIEKFISDVAKDFDFWIDPAVTDVINASKSAALAAQAAKESLAMGMADRIHKLVSAYNLYEPLPVGWALRDYQRQGVEWLLAHTRNNLGKGAILADHMGLGKTIQALAAARSLQCEYPNCPIIVICPVSLMGNWRIEAKYVGVGIETYSWAKMPPPLESTNYILIVDEAHYSQGGTGTKRGKAFLELCKNENCVAAWLLTGTPMKNGAPLNILPLLQAIDHPVARDDWQFKMRYCNGHKKPIGNGRTAWDFTGSAYLKELSDQLNDSLLRRMKSECAKELPGKTRMVRPVEETRTFREAIDLVVSDYKRKIKAVAETDPEKAEKLRNAEALVTIGKIRETASYFKVADAIEIAENILANGQSIVLFTEFLSTAKLLHEKLGGELLTGGTKTDDRQAIVDRFQSGESKVFIGTIKAGGVGITLTAASEIVIVDRPWTPGDLEQAEDRIYRIGQVNQCFCYWLQLGEVDRAIDELLHQKAERIELMLKGKRKTLRGVGSPMALAKAILENMI
jgi:Helicase conserved C-terminal domain/SNF2-related domain